MRETRNVSDGTDKDAPGADLDKLGQEAIEGRTGTADVPGGVPSGAAPAGPHETPSLTNHDATAGTGSLPSPTSGDEVDAATG